MTNHLLSAILNAFWGFIVLKSAWYLHVGLSNIGQGLIDAARVAAGKLTASEMKSFTSASSKKS